MSRLGKSYVYEVDDNLSGVSSQDLENQRSIASKEIPLFTLVKNTSVHIEFEKIESPILENCTHVLNSSSITLSSENSTETYSSSKNFSEDLFMQKELEYKNTKSQKGNQISLSKNSSEEIYTSSKTSFEESKSSKHFDQNDFCEELEDNGSILTEYSVNSFISVTEAFEEDFYDSDNYEVSYKKISEKTKKHHKKCVLF